MWKKKHSNRVFVWRATQRLFIKHQTVYCVLDLVFPFDCCCVLPIRWSTETQCRCTEPFCPCEAPSHSPRAAFSSLSLHPQQTPAEWHMSLLRSKGFVSTTVQSPGLQLFSSSWQLHVGWKHLYLLCLDQGLLPLWLTAVTTRAVMQELLCLQIRNSITA